MFDNDQPKFDDAQIQARLAPLIDAAKESLLYYKEPDLSHVSDAGLETQIRTASELLGSAVIALLQTYTAYKNTIVALAISRHSPWPAGEITPSQHLELAWSQFVNQCCLFRDKAKLFANRYNQAMATLQREAKSIDVTTALKAIDRELARHIEARGSSMHEWYAEHSELDDFDAADIIDATDRIDSPLGDIGARYDRARLLLGTEITDAIGFMADFQIANLDDHAEPLIEAIRAFGSLMNETTMKAEHRGATQN